jgi:hypothetical protein
MLSMDDSLWMRFFMKIDYIVDNNFPPPARVCHSAVVCLEKKKQKKERKDIHKK